MKRSSFIENIWRSLAIGYVLHLHAWNFSVTYENSRWEWLKTSQRTVLINGKIWITTSSRFKCNIKLPLLTVMKYDYMFRLTLAFIKSITVWRSLVCSSQIYSNMFPTRCNFTQFIYIWKLLYMFRVLLPLIIRSAYNCIYSIWYLSHGYCYLPL